MGINGNNLSFGFIAQIFRGDFSKIFGIFSEGKSLVPFSRKKAQKDRERSLNICAINPKLRLIASIMLCCLYLATFESQLSSTLTKLTEQILLIYNGPRAGSAYTIGEAITQKEHALQAADLAQRTDPNDLEMIVAALLHDIGQLIYTALS